MAKIVLHPPPPDSLTLKYILKEEALHYGRQSTPLIFEPTCAHARWALMHHFLSVWCLTVRKTQNFTLSEVKGEALLI